MAWSLSKGKTPVSSSMPAMVQDRPSERPVRTTGTTATPTAIPSNVSVSASTSVAKLLRERLMDISKERSALRAGITNGYSSDQGHVIQRIAELDDQIDEIEAALGFS